jgi:hypothetical protein
VCESNIQSRGILLADSIDGVYPGYDCYKIVDDIDNYFTYGWWQANRYLFTKLLLGHEQLHVNSFQNEIQRFYNDYAEEYREDLAEFTCEDFQNTSEAENYANAKILEVTFKWIIIATLSDPIFGFRYHSFMNLTIEDLERALHTRMYKTITAWWIEAISNCN